MKSQTMSAIKAELKTLATSIRANRASYKDAQRSNIYHTAGDLERKLKEDKYEYRHKLIAYSLLRGRTLEQIENPKEGNEPDQKYIGSLMTKYLAALHKEREVAA